MSSKRETPLALKVIERSISLLIWDFLSNQHCPHFSDWYHHLGLKFSALLLEDIRRAQLTKAAISKGSRSSEYSRPKSGLSSRISVLLHYATGNHLELIITIVSPAPALFQACNLGRYPERQPPFFGSGIIGVIFTWPWPCRFHQPTQSCIVPCSFQRRAGCVPHQRRPGVPLLLCTHRIVVYLTLRPYEAILFQSIFWLMTKSVTTRVWSPDEKQDANNRSQKTWLFRIGAESHFGGGVLFWERNGNIACKSWEPNLCDRRPPRHPACTLEVTGSLNRITPFWLFKNYLHHRSVYFNTLKLSFFKLSSPQQQPLPFAWEDIGHSWNFCNYLIHLCRGRLCLHCSHNSHFMPFKTTNKLMVFSPNVPFAQQSMSRG